MNANYIINQPEIDIDKTIGVLLATECQLRVARYRYDRLVHRFHAMVVQAEAGYFHWQHESRWEPRLSPP